MGKKVKLDMSGVESYTKASEGQHVAKIISADMKESQGGNDMVVCVFEVIGGNDKGCRVFDNFPLTETALWKLKGMLTAVGVRADGKIVLDLDKLVGKCCIIEVFHEEYNGQMRAKINEYKKANISDDPYEDDEEDEDEPAPAPIKKKAPPAKKPVSKKVEEQEIEAKDDEDDDWEDEEEEEKPAPKKKAPVKPEPKAATKKSVKKKPEPEEDNDEDDEDDWEEA